MSTVTASSSVAASTVPTPRAGASKPAAESKRGTITAVDQHAPSSPPLLASSLSKRQPSSSTSAITPQLLHPSSSTTLELPGHVALPSTSPSAASTSRSGVRALKERGASKGVQEEKEEMVTTSSIPPIVSIVPISSGSSHHPHHPPHNTNPLALSSSPLQTNIYHFLLTAPPYTLRVNSNALIGVIMDYIREKALKGVQGMLNARLAKIRADVGGLVQEENKLTASHTTHMNELNQVRQKLLDAMEKEKEEKELAEQRAAGGATPDVAGISPGGGDGAGEQKDELVAGAGDASTASSTRGGGAHAPPHGVTRKQSVLPSTTTSSTSSKKNKRAASTASADPEPPSDDPLLLSQHALDAATHSHQSRVTLLQREKDGLGHEEQQVVMDLTWVRGMMSGATQAGEKSNAAASRPTTTATTAATIQEVKSTATSQQPIAPTSTSAAVIPSTGLKSRKIKSGGGNRDATTAASNATTNHHAPVSLAPVGGVFIGLDLCTITPLASAVAPTAGNAASNSSSSSPSTNTCLNLRTKPLVYGTTCIKANQTYQLVAVYAMAGENSKSSECVTQAVPIAFAGLTPESMALRATTPKTNANSPLPPAAASHK